SDEVRIGNQPQDREGAWHRRTGLAARPRRRGDRVRRREFITLLGGVSPLRNSKLAVILFAASLIILWGNVAMAMTLKSPAFQQNGHIPSKYTCEGEDVSPPLAWEDAPDRAKSLVLIIDDPDTIRKHPRWFGHVGSSTTCRPIPRACPRTQARHGYRKAP